MEIKSKEESERQKKKKRKKKHNVQDSWDNRNHASLRITGTPEGKERERGIENICEEIVAYNFSNLRRK